MSCALPTEQAALGGNRGVAPDPPDKKVAVVSRPVIAGTPPLRQPPKVFRSPTVTHFLPTLARDIFLPPQHPPGSKRHRRLTMRQFWQNSKLSQVLNNTGDGLGVQGIKYRLSRFPGVHDLGTPKVGEIARG